ncbi:MAG: hypothetical protein HC905_19805 [Bacteroidales bacterium]|nr:hypothetical protein [Bacteroidales bacterium]
MITDDSPDGEDSIHNRRLNLVHKGYNLSATLAVSEPVEILSKRKAPKDEEAFRKILQQTNFTGEEKELIYKVTPRKKNKDSFAKVISGDKDITYRVFQKREPLHEKFSVSDVLVIKESGSMPIGWRIYKAK